MRVQINDGEWVDAESIRVDIETETDEDDPRTITVLFTREGIITDVHDEDGDLTGTSSVTYEERVVELE